MDINEIIHLEDRLRSDVAATAGDCIWSIGYERGRNCIEMELTRHLTDDEAEELCAQLSAPASYQGEGSEGSVFIIPLPC